MRSLFPMRVYTGEKWWTLYTAAALLRLADMADGVLTHMPARRDQDASAALRSMYELAVTVTWVLISPAARKELWEGEALIQQLKLHNDLATFGERLLTPTDIASARAATGLPALASRAAETDAHWSHRVDGLHAPGHLLSFRGLYNAIYRLGSQPTHGSIASLRPYVDQQSARFVIRPLEPGEDSLPYALVSPLLGNDAGRRRQRVAVDRRSQGADHQRPGVPTRIDREVVEPERWVAGLDQPRRGPRLKP